MNDQQIEDLLRSQRVAPVPDDGFTRQILSDLPPRRHSIQRWLAPAMTCLGGVLTFISMRGGSELPSALQGLARGEIITPLVFVPIALIFAGCLWALSEAK